MLSVYAPTESKRIFFQQLGRGLRPYPGKSHCVVIDFIGNFRNVYQILEYQGLTPFQDDAGTGAVRGPHTARDLLNLPLGCEVHFDDRVVDLFTRDMLDPAQPTGHNIAQILIYQYRKLARSFSWPPRKKDVDQYSILGSSFYELVFESRRCVRNADGCPTSADEHGRRILRVATGDRIHRRRRHATGKKPNRL